MAQAIAATTATAQTDETLRIAFGECVMIDGGYYDDRARKRNGWPWDVRADSAAVCRDVMVTVRRPAAYIAPVVNGRAVRRKPWR